ncbi:MAG: hypothetical protein QOI62_1281 [Solirubrobacteraceae bacterium]|jgi:hypothetical protein|nr:hypothetical protein [Solirubrobacteraceae bacterium]
MRALAVAVIVAAAFVAPAMATPVITPALFGTLGDNGWYRSNVLVNWDVKDDQGQGIAGEQNCGPTTLTADTPPSGTTLTCTATSQVDANTTITRSRSVTVSIDRIAPSALTAATDRPPDTAPWFNHPVEVTWAGTDGGSGVASCTSTPYAGPDALGASLSGTCRDRAGNVSAPLPFALDYDATPPAVTAVRVVAGDASAALSWQADGAAAFIVSRAPGRGHAAQSMVFDGTASSFTDRGLTVGRRYAYTVEAVDAAGNATTAAVHVTPERLLGPPAQARVTAPPVLRWHAIARASYYNVQLFRGGRKVLSAWPRRARYHLRRAWSFGGRDHRLAPGRYRWYVWPGYGPRARNRYGRLLGQRAFVVG